MEIRGKVALINAGGRVVAKRTMDGDEPVSVHLEPQEVIELIPDALREAVTLVDWSHLPGSHYSLRMISDLVQVASAQVMDGAVGVIITCDEQSIEEMAYFCDLVWSYPQPLMFVARSFFCNDLGNDSSRALQRAVQAVLSQACWGKRVLVNVEDVILPAADAVWVSNCNVPRFEAHIGAPIALFFQNEVLPVYCRKRGHILPIETNPVRRVEILCAALGGGETILADIMDKSSSELDGLILEGFGCGEIPPTWTPYVKKLIRSGVVVVLASRCLNGRVQPEIGFEGSASRLIDLGALNGGGLNAFQARIKLSLGLGAGLKDKELQAYLIEDE
jgi:L-asparaginase